MAKIVLGLGSSHAPQLEIPPDKWQEYGDRGRKLNEHWYNGQTYTFQELADLRAGDHFERECTYERYKERFDACQRGIQHLSATLARVKPDVCVILGDDQEESFHEDNMPAFCIYNGETVDDSPPGDRHFDVYPYGIHPAGNPPSGRVTHRTDAALAEYLVEALIERDFDVARSNKLPEGRDHGAIGHAFYYAYRRLMNHQVIPNVPILVNTYYPPNAPLARRCYKFGRALREAIEAWDTDKRVAIIASGGLSHTVIEEDLDHRLIDGMKTDDFAKLTDLPDARFRNGTSEVKNWIILAGAVGGSGLEMNLVDYVPCYRTEAGTGCAMGFAEWTGA